MAGKIRLLSEDLVGKIAAGEVVERPASVVKELVENSLDAGADNIDVEIRSGGILLIRVADNGEGMSDDDAELACRQHATSKIKRIEDLNSVFTLGFRGEALASISSVSQTDIITKSDKQENGVYLYLESGEILKKRPVGRARGTTIEVRNLFYNVPARRKFLKKESTEMSEIVAAMGRFILSWPDVEFKLSNEGKCLLRATRDMNIKERIKLILGEDAADKMFRIEGEDLGYKMSGYISLPSWTRKDRRGQLFFINKRFVKSKSIGDSLSGAYWSMLERGRHPLAVLFVEVPSDSVDVNVHPAKLLVKFEDDTFIRKFIKETVKNGFNSLRSSPEHIAVLPEQKRDNTGKLSVEDELVLREKESVQNEFKYDLGKGSGGVKTSGRQSVGPIAAELKKYLDQSIFQFADCYIVQVLDQTLKITDQHAAHERILYEYFSKALEDEKVDSQNLLFPVRLDMPASEKIVLEKILPDFKRLGFVIEEFGNNSFVVQTVPAKINDSDIKTIILDVFADLKEYDLSKINIVDELVKRTACRAAIKAGDQLTREEMYALLEQLAGCSLPFTCPHGRPTTLDISIDELEKRFHRK